MSDSPSTPPAKTTADQAPPLELIVNPDPKPGLKSTEFWLVLAANVLAVTLAMLQEIRAEWAVGAVTVLTAIYSLLRGGLKAGTRQAVEKAAAKGILPVLVVASLALTLGGCEFSPGGGISPHLPTIQWVVGKAVRSVTRETEDGYAYADIDASGQWVERDTGRIIPPEEYGEWGIGHESGPATD